MSLSVKEKNRLAKRKRLQEALVIRRQLKPIFQLLYCPLKGKIQHKKLEKNQRSRGRNNETHENSRTHQLVYKITAILFFLVSHLYQPSRQTSCLAIFGHRCKRPSRNDHFQPFKLQKKLLARELNISLDRSFHSGADTKLFFSGREQKKRGKINCESK